MISFGVFGFGFDCCVVAVAAAAVTELLVDNQAI